MSNANSTPKLCECGCGLPAPIAKISQTRSGHIRGMGMRFIHGHHAKKHGLFRTPEYATWAAMKGRCSNPREASYSRYGGRGISVCNRWLSFEGFFADMGRRPSKKHSLDRINNDGNYEPGNCRWATDTEQCNNQRRNVFVEYGGERKTLAQWARHYGFAYYVISSRHKLGIRPPELFVPVKRGQRLAHPSTS